MLGSWDKSQGRPDLAPGSTLGLELLHTFSYLKSLALSPLSGRRPPLCGKAVPTQAPSGSTSGMVRQHRASWVWRREPRDPGPVSQALLPACATEASPPLLPPGMRRSVTSAITQADLALRERAFQTAPWPLFGSRLEEMEENGLVMRGSRQQH